MAFTHEGQSLSKALLLRLELARRELRRVLRTPRPMRSGDHSGRLGGLVSLILYSKNDFNFPGFICFITANLAGRQIKPNRISAKNGLRTTASNQLIAPF